MRSLPSCWAPCICAVLLCSLPTLAVAQSQGMDARTRFEVHGMLKDGYDNLRKQYYDPTFHGVDLDKRYHFYDAQIDQVQKLGQGLGLISAFLSELKDSHVFFEPPRRPVAIDAGYRMDAIGDACYVTAVRPGSDAVNKLHPGDAVLRFQNYDVTRSSLRDMELFFHFLSPAGEDHLLVKPLAGEPRQVAVQSMVRPRKTRLDLTGRSDADEKELLLEGDQDNYAARERIAEFGDVIVWKMSTFGFDTVTLDRVMSKAQKHGTLVLDLRDNEGGLIDSLEQLVGRLFNHPVKIAEVNGRKPQKPIVSYATGHHYDGKIVVLINSDSASASELFARTIQLLHRGTVMGDRSAGAVMESLSFDGSLGADSKIYYGFSITVADLIMPDGKDLEHVGVEPDVLALPTADDLAHDRDPVLAKAVSDAGISMDPVAAGKIFPREWPELK